MTRLSQRNTRFTMFLGVCSAFGLVATSCSDDSGEPIREDMSIVDPDPSDIMEVEVQYPDGSKQIRPVIVDQILVMFAKGLSIADAQATVGNMERDHADVNLRWVGQIPVLGIYQLEIDNQRDRLAGAR